MPFDLNLWTRGGNHLKSHRFPGLGLTHRTYFFRAVLQLRCNEVKVQSPKPRLTAEVTACTCPISETLNFRMAEQLGG